MANESLSALLDGECSAAEIDRLLAEMGRSPALRQEWSRLCLTRELTAGTRVLKEQPCICAGVMAHLDAAPQAQPHTKVVSLAERRAARTGGAWRWKHVASLAAAASVAGAALVISFGTGTTVMTASRNVIAPTGTPVAQNNTVALARPVAMREPGEDRWTDAGDDLDDYLMEHSSSVAGLGGATLGYARFAAHSAAYHPDQP